MTVQYNYVNEPAFSSGIHAHANNANEQDVLTFSKQKRDVAVSLDMSNLTQITTVRVYEKTDGVNYKAILAPEYPSDFVAGVNVVEVQLTGKGQDMKITMQSSVAEGGVKNVPYSQKIGGLIKP